MNCVKIMEMYVKGESWVMGKEKKKAIKEQYRAKAETHIEDIKQQITANSEKTLNVAKENCEKRIKRLDKLTAENSESWIEDIFNRTISN